MLQNFSQAPEFHSIKRTATKTQNTPSVKRKFRGQIASLTDAPLDVTRLHFLQKFFTARSVPPDKADSR
jgi:hypothetical protein